MDSDFNIVLLGKTGVGKSASGNTILGRPAFESRLCFKSVTKKISVETGNVFGKRVSVVDTPGILDTKEDIKTCCQVRLQSSTPCLFLVVIQVGRFTKEDRKAVKLAQEALGPKGLKKGYLLFTGGDALKNMSLEDFIFEDDEGTLPTVVRRMAGAYHLFNNENQDQEQVRELLLKSGHLRTAGLSNEPTVSEDRRIVLIGRPGAGKSSSGNTILGSKRFKSGCDFNPVSTECVSESAQVEERQVTVVDTTGSTDEVLNPKQLYMEIMKTLVHASPGPHAFVVVVRLGRVSEADSALFEVLPKLFGSEASKYIMVLFTGGDELEGKSVDELIQSNSCISKLVSMCVGGYCVFDNSHRGNRQQVRRFLSQIDEMVTANGGDHYTSDLFRMAETFIREERNCNDPSSDSSSPGPTDEATSTQSSPSMYGPSQKNEMVTANGGVATSTQSSPSKYGGGDCVFDNSHRGNRQQVRRCPSQKNEMVTANGGVATSTSHGKLTRAWKRLYSFLEIIWDQLCQSFINFINCIHFIYAKVSRQKKGCLTSGQL